MKQLEKLSQLKNLSYFDTQTIGQITGLRDQQLINTISRWMKQNELINLKRGLYTTESYYNKHAANHIEYSEYISNKLRYPSYLSLEYVLSRYQILSESVFSFTAITVKSTRNYTNRIGQFIYRSISEKLFSGYSIQEGEKYDRAIASKSKALFDYLYLKLYHIKNITPLIVNEMRLNLDSFGQLEKEEFGRYCALSEIEKFIKLPKMLFTE